jgi:N-acetylmuramoyl-L-alanine amidase
MKKIYILTLLMLMAVVAHAAKAKTFTLVIDAGHGGHDAGAIGAVTKEKTINLNVALAFGRMVERNCKDVKVIYTRKTDVFVPLHTRADIANKAKADLFISIHTNALPKKRISRGMETYTLGMHRAADNLDVAKRENSVILIEKDYKQRYQGFDPNSSESYIMFEFIQDRNMAKSVELAKLVQKRTCATAGRQNKGVKQAGFLVLRETSMPSCLIELGFISTPDEESFLNSSDGVEKLGKGIYQAFVDYYKKTGSGSKVTEIKEEVKNDVKAEVKQEVKPEVKAEEPKVRPKGKMARELADVREGRVDVEEEQVLPVAPKLEEPEPAEEIVKEDSVAVVKVEPAPEPTPERAPKPVQEKKPTPVATETSGAPVFKLQILASSTKLKTTDPQLKGQKQADCYREGGLYKYTLGSSEDYNEINQLRKAQQTRFPQAFIIAFKNGQKMNVQEAIQEYKSKKVKK